MVHYVTTLMPLSTVVPLQYRVPLDVQNIYLKIFLALHLFFVHVQKVTLRCFPCYEMKCYATDHKNGNYQKDEFLRNYILLTSKQLVEITSLKLPARSVACCGIKILIEHSRRLSVICARDSRRGIGEKMLYHCAK